ncbi:MAG: cobalt ECF transporter T component CbiQ [Leptodesmis sp.]|uniref:cobalt ECF transporter T component CbiQ n=1 Tax=Leptodesmis sp. TaxID=3100501 RepID=UPI003D0A2B74
MLLLHLGSIHLDVDSKRSTLWHTLVPQTRVLCVVLSVFAISFTPNGQWWTWAVYAIGILRLLLLSQVTWAILLRRLMVESAFVGVVLLGTLFREGGQVLWQWGWLKITTAGLTILGSVTVKAVLCLILLNVLTLTTSVPLLLHALVALKVPPLLVAIMASMYRYIAVLVDEFTSMRRAALSRNLMDNRNWQRLAIGNMFGSLFIRTYEQGERVHQAMLARGYEGIPPVADLPTGSRLDLMALTLTILVVLVGQAIYLF